MLVLSRRIEEKIILPTVPASIKLISALNGQARLGIEVPPHIPILREELCPQLVSEAISPSEAPLRQTLRTRINNVILGVSMLQARLQNIDEELRDSVESISQELEAIRLCLSAQPPETNAVILPMS